MNEGALDKNNNNKKTHTCTANLGYFSDNKSLRCPEINHRSYVQRHVSLFSLHVNSSATNLPSEFKEKRTESEIHQVNRREPDKQRAAAVKSFPWETVAENQRLWDPRWEWKLEK